MTRKVVKRFIFYITGAFLDITRSQLTAEDTLQRSSLSLKKEYYCQLVNPKKLSLVFIRLLLKLKDFTLEMAAQVIDTRKRKLPLKCEVA